MMLKRGVNTTREEKNGPTVRRGISSPAKRRFRKVLTCPNCKTRLEKFCENEMFCEISSLKCPRCGEIVS
jgi:hypothetical protein